MGSIMYCGAHRRNIMRMMKYDSQILILESGYRAF